MLSNRLSVHILLFLVFKIFRRDKPSIGESLYMAHVLVKKIKKNMKAGETVFREGEKGDTMYIIRSGRVKIIKKAGGKDIALAALKTGDFFGEMCLFGRFTTQRDCRCA